jgi:hypothetical protein
VVVLAVPGEGFDWPVEPVAGRASDRGGFEWPAAGAQDEPAPHLGRKPAAPGTVLVEVGRAVNFADPVNLVPLAAGITAGIGNLTIKFTSTFSITGLAAGTLIVIIGYHAVRPFARPWQDQSQAGGDATRAPP